MPVSRKTEVVAAVFVDAVEMDSTRLGFARMTTARCCLPALITVIRNLCNRKQGSNSGVALRADSEHYVAITFHLVFLKMMTA